MKQPELFVLYTAPAVKRKTEGFELTWLVAWEDERKKGASREAITTGADIGHLLFAELTYHLIDDFSICFSF